MKWFNREWLRAALAQQLRAEELQAEELRAEQLQAGHSQQGQGTTAPAGGAAEAREEAGLPAPGAGSFHIPGP